MSRLIASQQNMALPLFFIKNLRLFTNQNRPLRPGLNIFKKIKINSPKLPPMRPSLSLQAIHREDIDEISVSASEVTSFLQLNVDSGNNENNSNYSKISNLLSSLNVLSYANSKHTEYETKKSGYHFIWSENSRTGEFASTRSKQESINDTNDSDNGARELSIDANDSSQLLPSPLSSHGKNDIKSLFVYRKVRPTHSSIVVFMRGFYLCFQGLLTGFAFSTIFLESTAGNDAASFLENYQPNSNDFRRLLYIFSTISLVGSVDIVMTLMSQFSSKSTKRKSFGNRRSAGGFFVIAVFAALFHIIVFLLTVIMSATDTLVYIKFGHSESDWANSASENSAVISNIKVWKGLDRVRFICALIAWGGCCLLSWRDLMILVGKESEAEALYDIILLWKKRCSELEGERIDELDEVSLRQLVEIQSSGLQRSRDALQVFDSV